MSVIKCKIISVSEGEYQKIFSAIGRTSSEEINSRSYFQHVGFSSRPPADAVGIILTDGNNYTMIATADPAASRPTLTNEKDSCIYADADKYVMCKSGGDIEVANNNNKIILKSNGDIEIGDGTLKQLVHEDVFTAMNAHTHPDPVAGITGPPTYTPVLSKAAHCTQKTKAE